MTMLVMMMSMVIPITETHVEMDTRGCSSSSDRTIFVVSYADEGATFQSRIPMPKHMCVRADCNWRTRASLGVARCRAVRGFIRRLTVCVLIW